MSYTEQLQRLADMYFEHHSEGTSREILRWAWENKLWEPHPDDFLRQGAEQLARAMREDYKKDPQGRDVRTKHVIKVERGGEQMCIWISDETATRDQMEMAFQYRRNQIVGDCKQLKKDADSYNENKNPGEPIQVILDFRDDVEEAELAELLRAG